MTEEDFGAETAGNDAAENLTTEDAPSRGSRQWEIDALERALQQMRHGSAEDAQAVADSADAVSDVAPTEESSTGVSLGALMQQLDTVREDIQNLSNQPTTNVSGMAAGESAQSAGDDEASADIHDQSDDDQSGDDPAEDDPADNDQDDRGDQAPSALALLFQAPAPVQSRRASRPAGPPVVLEDDGAEDDGAEDDEAADGGTSDADDSDAAAGAGLKTADADSDDDSDPDADADSETDDASDADGKDGSDGRRRRRRRGGRGRKRRSGEDSADEQSTDTDSEDDDDSAEDESGDSEEESSSSSRRRRRRRRRGSASGDDASTDDPPNTVTKVRSGRRARDEITGVKGSTRLEAKRQRRREGREFARRRPIISEAEFLARRESVDRTMLVREHEGRTQLVVLEDGVLVEHYVARKASASLIGNVYLGKVQNVLPSMEAAFVDIGRGRNAVLYAGEVNWDAAGVDGSQRRIELALKAGDPVVVQVTKDPLGHKGARLTSQVSLPGRYLVYVPGASMTGISRKLPDTERSRLKAILREVVPEDGGVIVRTAAEGASEEELRRDVERLVAEWESIQKKSGAVNAPSVLHAEPDLITKVVRDVFNEDFAMLVVSGDEPWNTVHGYVEQVAPDLIERVERWDGEKDIFTAHRVDEQLAKALDRKVWLPSGGSLVIDRTEAMTVVDVNTGRFVGSGGNLEETVTKNNLEAAEEIVRQLRLRDVGGIVVIDFIDMVLDSNRDLVLRRLVECLGRDRTKHQVAEVTSLGLVQMTRKRVGQGLLEAFSEPCEHCSGRGVQLFDEPIVNPAQMSGNGSGNGGNNSGSDRNNDRRNDRRDRNKNNSGNDDATSAEAAAAAAKEAEQHRRAAAEAARMAEAARKAKERSTQTDTEQAGTEQAGTEPAESAPAGVGADLAALEAAVAQISDEGPTSSAASSHAEPASDGAVASPSEPVAPVEPPAPTARGRRRRRATSPATSPKPVASGPDSSGSDSSGQDQVGQRVADGNADSGEDASSPSA